MNILLFTHYFHPEYFVINDIVQILCSEGHTVTVVTGNPNYPEGAFFKGYNKNAYTVDSYEGATVHRIPVFPRRSGKATSLLLNYLSYIFSSLWYLPKILKNLPFDQIVVFAPSPITTAFPALITRYIKKKPLTLWVQDLWPDAFEATGFIKNKNLLAIIRFFTEKIYKYSDKILVQSKDYFDIITKHKSIENVYYFPTPSKEYTPYKGENKKQVLDIIKKIQSTNSVVYAGNIGHAQNIPLIISAAKKLHQKNIQIFLVGTGPLYGQVKKQIENENIKNVTLTGYIENKYMPNIFQSAYTLLLSLNPHKNLSKTIPGKVSAYLSSGRPIIASSLGASKKIIEESASGITSDPSSPAALAENIMKMIRISDEQHKKYCRNAKEYFKQQFEINKKTKDLIVILEKKAA